MLDGGKIAVADQLSTFRVGEHHAGLRIIADVHNFPDAQLGIHGSQRYPGLGGACDDLHVLDAVRGNDRPVLPGLDTQPVQQ